MLVLEILFGWLLKKVKVLDYEGRKDYDHEELFKNLKIRKYILYFKGLYDQVYLRVLLT